MAIIKHSSRSPSYTTWRDFDEPLNRLARLFDDSSVLRSRDGFWTPAVTVTETKDELVLTAELPGMAEEDINVELENNVLSISGEKTEERKEGDEERQYHVWERSYGSFRRAFTLPRTVSGEDVAARFENGVLTVTLPKAPEAKGRKIEIAKN